ncbi:amidohydrolase family protein [Streptomyces sp. NPDC000851]
MIPGGPVSPALCIQGSAKPTDKNDGKGILRPGYYGDLAVLSDDFFTVPEQDIPHIESLLTLVGGRIVHAAGASEGLDEEPPDQPTMEPGRPLRRLPGHRRRPGTGHARAPRATAAPAAAPPVRGRQHLRTGYRRVAC